MTACAKCGETEGAQPAPPGKVWLCDRCDHEVDLALEVAPTITVSLKIENTYELYDDVTTVKTDIVIEAPPAEQGDEYDEWAQEHVYEHTGTGNCEGDSWYDVTVTASSDPVLLAVGTTFEFGY